MSGTRRTTFNMTQGNWKQVQADCRRRRAIEGVRVPAAKPINEALAAYYARESKPEPIETMPAKVKRKPKPIEIVKAAG